MKREDDHLEAKREQSSVFAIRTTAGQEKNVADIMASRAMSKGLEILTILAPETLKGYLFVEARSAHFVEDAIAGIKHIKSRVPGLVSFVEIESYVVTRPVIDELEAGTSVEIIGGPFKGMKANITRVDRSKNEVTLELLEATFTLPITVHSDYVKLTRRAEGVPEKVGKA
jgi:transcriptional antiterminator NusG